MIRSVWMVAGVAALYVAMLVVTLMGNREAC